MIVLPSGPLPGRAVEHHRLAEARHVAVAQVTPPADALAVDVGAVAREAVVDERPLPAAALEMGVQRRDLAVPLEADARRQRAADPHVVVALVERDDALRALGVAVDEERVAGALRVELRLHLLGRPRTGPCGLLGHPRRSLRCARGWRRTSATELAEALPAYEIGEVARSRVVRGRLLGPARPARPRGRDQAPLARPARGPGGRASASRPRRARWPRSTTRTSSASTTTSSTRARLRADHGALRGGTLAERLRYALGPARRRAARSRSPPCTGSSTPTSTASCTATSSRPTCSSATRDLVKVADFGIAKVVGAGAAQDDRHRADDRARPPSWRPSRRAARSARSLRRRTCGQSARCSTSCLRGELPYTTNGDGVIEVLNRRVIEDPRAAGRRRARRARRARGRRHARAARATPPSAGRPPARSPRRSRPADGADDACAPPACRSTGPRRGPPAPRRRRSSRRQPGDLVPPTLEPAPARRRGRPVDPRRPRRRRSRRWRPRSCSRCRRRLGRPAGRPPRRPRRAGRGR